MKESWKVRLRNSNRMVRMKLREMIEKSISVVGDVSAKDDKD